jgi:3-deoxy-D-manno-octulosonate 8-phosphate phosphatase (KDO 8-P phosphatase)
MGPFDTSQLTTSLLGSLAAVRLAVFDFDGVFTDNRVWVFQDGREAVACSRADGIGLTRLQLAGVAVQVLSTEPNPVVAARCAKLRIPCIQDSSDKLLELRSIAQRQAYARESVAYVGNDINDLECLVWAGVPIVVRDAHPSVADKGLYRTQALGGLGAVREVCDLIVAIKGQMKANTWPETYSASGTASSS